MPVNLREHREPGGKLVLFKEPSLVPDRRVDEAAGWPLLLKGRMVISPAAGLAIAANGDIYYDADSGNGWASGALVEVTPAGHVRVLWRAPD